MVEACTATTRGGTPCRGQAWKDGLCRVHHPELADERAAYRARGGTARSTAARARKQYETLVLQGADLEGVLGSTLVRVLNGELPPNVGNSVATIARSLVTVREATDIERRLAELEDERDARTGGKA